MTDALPPLPEPVGDGINISGDQWQRDYTLHQDAYTADQMRAYAEQAVSADRARLLSMPALMHACDAVGVPANGEYAELLRAALTLERDPRSEPMPPPPPPPQR